MTPLQDQLDEITSNTRHLVQPERLAISERAVEDLFATGIEDRILPVGAQAPEFALKDSNGKLVRSRDLLALGPLVIKFFRGRWCPYCVTELETWRDLYGKLREGDALLVAVTPQTERQSDFPPPTSSGKTARSSTPKRTPTSASAPNPKKPSPPATSTRSAEPRNYWAVSAPGLDSENWASRFDAPDDVLSNS
jgi:thiol-disulfide isomerase/thioredoxin